jgi:hypothetical protein
MATVRVASIKATGSPPASKRVRVASISASGTLPNAAAAKVRLSSLSVTGSTASVTANARVRIAELSVVGGAALVLDTISSRFVEPYSTVTTIASSPSAVVSYTWRQISGPTVVLTGSGATRSFVAPASKDASTVVLGVKGWDSDGNAAPELQVSVYVYPHTMFVLSGSTWKPAPITGVPAAGSPPVVLPPVTSATVRVSKLSAVGTVPATPVAPTLGTTVTDHGKTYTWDLAQNFTVDAPLGTVRTKYPSMAYFDTASQGFRDTSSQGYWAPDKVLSVSNGALDFNMHSELIGGVSTPLVSCVMPDNYQSRLHGVFEVRFKTTANKKGYKFVGMFWPTNDNWNQGEIDWPEADLTETPRPANAVPGTGKDAAGQPADGSAVKSMSFVPPTAQYAATDSSDWHTARTVWNADGLYFYWDGALVWSTTDTSVIPTQPMRIELQAETFIGEGAVPADAVGHVMINYVAAAS